MASKILIVDPLTLMGRELTRCIEETPDLAVEVDYRHTAEDDEHQIAELGAEPALVPPLDDAGDTGNAGIVVIASDTETERTRHLEDLLTRHPDLTVVDVGRVPGLFELTAPALGNRMPPPETRHLRVAHPALAATAAVLDATRFLSPVRGSVAAVEPVSVFGRDALETLVHQAGRRLQGGDPDHDIGGHVLAFNQVAVESEGLTVEAAELLPEVSLAVTRISTGCFHGHVAHLNLEFAAEIEEPDLREALESTGRLLLADPPLALDMVTDRDQVLLTQPQISTDRRLVAFTTMVDGLRLGGAVTAVEILRSMTVH